MIQELSCELFQLRQEVKEITERHEAELAPKKAQMAQVQQAFIDELTKQGLKSIKTDDANYSLSTRKGFRVLSEAHAIAWAKENNAIAIDKRIMAQKLKDMDEVPDFFETTESQSLTVKAAA